MGPDAGFGCPAGKKAVAPVGQLLWPEALAAFDDLVEVKVVLDGDELMGEGNCMHGKLLFGKIVAMPDSRWKLVSIRTLCGEGDGRRGKAERHQF